MSPRPRKKKRNLPPYTYFGKGRWYHREYLGDGKLGRELKLAGPKATDEEIWQVYLDKVGVRSATGTLRWLSDEYFSSPYFSRRAITTQREYRRYARRILDTRLKDGRIFGDIRAKRITPGVIRRYMDMRAKSAPVMANRELEFLSVVFGFGYERDYVSVNPAKGVKPQPERPRTRYVTDAEYQAVYDRATPYVQIAMELAYLCRLRRGEIIGPDPRDVDSNEPPKYEGLQRKHVLQKGLHVIRAKGSKEQIIAWTPRLRAAVDRALDLPSQVASFYLLHDKRGQRIRKRAFSSAWQRAVKNAVLKNGIQPFTFHDLKAKGVSDFVGDKIKASGHKSFRMVSIYDRSIELVASTK
jgi:integrase